MLDAEGILIRPILTEKSWREMEQGKYTFLVHPQATKADVRRAVEELFGVNVVRIWTMYRPGKARRTRMDRRFGRTPAQKRAIVQLGPGQKIDIVG